MKRITNGIIISVTWLLMILFIASCTPGRTQTRRDIFNEKRDNKVEKYTNNDENFNLKNNSLKSNENSEVQYDFDNNTDTDDKDYSLNKESFYQTGTASWYGREFHGKVTASGEKFNMNELTAAHKTLPFGTIVEIKNLDNGKIVKVKINDRGPYNGNRIIDLSYNAAKKLGMIKPGTAFVGIKLVKKGIESDKNDNINSVAGDNSNDNNEIDGNYSLQVGAFYSKRNADNLKKKVETITENKVVVINEGDLYKVRVEGINSKNDVNKYKKLLAEEDIPAYLIKKKE